MREGRKESFEADTKMKEKGPRRSRCANDGDSIVLLVGKVFLFGYYLLRRCERGDRKESVRWKMCALFRVSALVLKEDLQRVTSMKQKMTKNKMHFHRFCGEGR